MYSIRAFPQEETRSFVLDTGHSKYKTDPMDDEIFEDCLFYTTEDWEHFLRTSDKFTRDEKKVQ